MCLGHAPGNTRANAYAHEARRQTDQQVQVAADRRKRRWKEL